MNIAIRIFKKYDFPNFHGGGVFGRLGPRRSQNAPATCQNGCGKLWARWRRNHGGSYFNASASSSGRPRPGPFFGVRASPKTPRLPPSIPPLRLCRLQSSDQVSPWFPIVHAPDLACVSVLPAVCLQSALLDCCLAHSWAPGALLT